MNKIKKAAKNILKKTKGNTSFAAIEEWLLSQGYVVIFYNTVVGDTEISRYHLEKTAENTKAFTYNSLAKVVFIDNTVSAEDKNYLLFHETGHVALKHLNINRISTENKILLDIEADAVAYELMHYKSNTKQILLTIVLILASFISGIAVSRISSPQPPETAETVSVSVHDNSATEVPVLSVDESNEFVYVTPTGKRYHRSDCRYVKNKNCTELNIEQAIKNYTPCKVCNP